MAKDVGDQRVLAAAEHIVRTLGSKNEHMTEDMVRIFSNFDDRFSNMNDFIHERSEPGGPAMPEALKKMQETLDLAEEIILRWEMPDSEPFPRTMIWESPPQEAAYYLKAVEEIQNMLTALPAEMLDRAGYVLGVAMVRLKEEFSHLLVMNSEAVDPDWLVSLQGHEDYIPSESSDDEDDEDIPIAKPVTDLSASFDLIPVERVRTLNLIAGRMVAAGRGHDGCEAYVNIRKIVLEQSLYRLGLERPKFEAVQKMAWEMLEWKIKKWIQAVKVAVKVIFASEKKLCDNVFHGLQFWQETCFKKLSMEAMMQFLTFPKAVATMHRTPEKLFRILDMYETIKELSPEMELIFSGKSWENVRTEVARIDAQLGEAAKETLKEFENAIQRDASKTPVPGGVCHPLTRYVMNYLKFLVEYADCLKQLLRDRKRGLPRYLGVETFGLDDSGRDMGSIVDPSRVSPVAVQVMWLMFSLESNLDEKSKLYKDPPLSFLFLMNNLHYIVQKIKQSELVALLGDDWLQKHSAQVFAYAANYVRTAWKKVFICLRDEGLMSHGHMTSAATRVAVKERFKNFNFAFEEAWKTQAGWLVPDPHLREKLRVDIVGKLVPVYREFINRYGSLIESGRQSGKYIRYYPDEIENYVLDLFE